jgi:hypothetical protein
MERSFSKDVKVCASNGVEAFNSRFANNLAYAIRFSLLSDKNRRVYASSLSRMTWRIAVMA